MRDPVLDFIMYVMFGFCAILICFMALSFLTLMITGRSLIERYERKKFEIAVGISDLKILKSLMHTAYLQSEYIFQCGMVKLANKEILPFDQAPRDVPVLDLFDFFRLSDDKPVIKVYANFYDVGGKHTSCKVFYGKLYDVWFILAGVHDRGWEDLMFWYYCCDKPFKRLKELSQNLADKDAPEGFDLDELYAEFDTPWWKRG